MNSSLKGIRLALVSGFLGMAALGSVQPASAGIFGDVGNFVGGAVRDVGRAADSVTRDVGRTVGNVFSPRPRVTPEPLGSTTSVYYRPRRTAAGGGAPCPSGLVWRERFDGDTVCVTPLERDTNRRRRGL